jgi:hypothetical protein
MLFASKQNDDKSPSAVEKTRSADRYDCIARISINGFEGEALLRNISMAGFCLESRTYAAITVGEHYIMQIKPEPISNIQPFDLEIEVRWIKSTETKFSAGFLIVKSPADRSLERYISYVKTQSNKPGV